MNEKILNAIKQLREENPKREFTQSFDLLINLKKFDTRKESINLSVTLPHKVKEVKIAAFLEKKSPVIQTITKPEFDFYKDKKRVKRLSKDYDYFIAAAKLMPSVATVFGKYLGPSGKMPAPGLGIIVNEDDNSINKELVKFNSIVKIKTKEPSVKLSIGNEKMNDEEIGENIEAVYRAILNALPKKKESIRSVLIKFTMSKPVKLADMA